MAQIQIVANPSLRVQPAIPAELELLSHDFTFAEVAEVNARSCDLVIVDARGQVMWARDICRVLAGQPQIVPIVVLLSANELIGIAPTWGIDDFVLETASAAEWDTRIRFARDMSRANEVVAVGPFVIDENAFTVHLDGKSLDLTYIEFELLKYLVTNPNRVLSRDRLLADVWGKDYYGGTRTVDVHIRRLRAKLGPEYDGHIGTVRNVGYRFTPER